MRMFYNKIGSKSTAVVLSSFVPFDREIWNSEKAKSVRARVQNCDIDCLLDCHCDGSLKEKISSFLFLLKKRAFQ